jgi:protein subunit release factor A
MKRKHLLSVTIKDCEVECFCAGKNGGQHSNSNKNAVRIRHLPSGAVGECREERYQSINKQRAFKRMGESKAFQTWVKLQASRSLNTKTPEQLVEEAMDPKQLKIEKRNKLGQWELESC